jgi:hypothetical protein
MQLINSGTKLTHFSWQCLFPGMKQTPHFRDEMYRDVAYRVISYRDETYGDVSYYYQDLSDVH